MIKIKESELHFSFVRSSGPGGQHVNKVSTAVQLKYNIYESDISDDMKQRFITAYEKRISKNGFITIIAQSFKSQKQNKDDAINRLEKLFNDIKIGIDSEWNSFREIKKILQEKNVYFYQSEPY